MRAVLRKSPAIAGDGNAVAGALNGDLRSWAAAKTIAVETSSALSGITTMSGVCWRLVTRT
jgi:hypothetical protein